MFSSHLSEIFPIFRHHYAGYSGCAGQCMTIDMEAFSAFEYNDETGIAHLGVGLRLGDVMDSLLPYGVVIPVGNCRYVGVGGHFQSSGLSPLTRMMGLGLDYVKSFRIAFANGTIATVTEEENQEDLYWAALGGNPGSWGVILDYEVQTVRDEDFPNTSVPTLILF